MYGMSSTKKHEAKMDALKHKREVEGEKAKVRGVRQRQINEMSDLKKDIQNIQSTKTHNKITMAIREGLKSGYDKTKVKLTASMKSHRSKKKQNNKGLYIPGRSNL